MALVPKSKRRVLRKATVAPRPKAISSGKPGKPVMKVVADVANVQELDKIDAKSFLKLKAEVESASRRGMKVYRNEFIPRVKKLAIHRQVQLKAKDAEWNQDPDSWKNLDNRRFFEIIPTLFTPKGLDPSARLGAEVDKLRFKMSDDFADEYKLENEVNEVLHECGFKQDLENFDEVDTAPIPLRKRIQRLIIERFKDGHGPVGAMTGLYKIFKVYDGGVPFKDFFAQVYKAVEEIRGHLNFNSLAGIGPRDSESSHTTKTYGDKKKKKFNPPETSYIRKQDGDQEDNGSRELCSGCGGYHGGGKERCWKGPYGVKEGKRKQVHPDWNFMNIPFHDTKKGKVYKTFPMKFIRCNKRLDVEKGILVHFEDGNVPFDKKRKSVNGKQTTLKKAKGFGFGGAAAIKDTDGKSRDLLVVSATTSSVKQLTDIFFYRGGQRVVADQAFVDNGADGNFIDATRAVMLSEHFECHKTTHNVCSCFGDCRVFNSSYTIDIDLPNLINYRLENVEFVVIPTLVQGIIIGRPLTDRITWMIRENPQFSPVDDPKACLLTQIDGGSVICDKSAFLHDDGDPDAGDQSIEDDADDWLDRLVDQPANETETSQYDKLPTGIYGDLKLQRDIRKLLEKYHKTFRRSVRKQAAKVKPMTIQVHKKQWATARGSQGAVRVQTQVKRDEISRQINEMLALEVIEESDAPNYSQVHLIKKPRSNKYRFTVDFRLLNSVTKPIGGVLPNIPRLLEDIGVQRPEWFAVMDLTSGFHQAPLDVASRKYTAFVTHRGIFQWKRVGMGLRNSPAYFQNMMERQVLKGLIGDCCQLYMDDCIIYGRTAEEFLDRLNRVLKRFQDYGMTINPDKCKFGLQEIEYVGYTINKVGVSFSREKLLEVYNISEPTTAKQLRSFLGLTSYFRRHIRGYADLERPLRTLLNDTPAGRSVKWSEEARLAFVNLKEAINACPRLFFPDDQLPVVVYTDASDYGIGGYVCQIDAEGKEIPISFLSKSLSKVEQRWTTIEKECWAIIVTIKKHEYLLRDRRFLLKTDHHNLIYMNEPPSQKVMRWKMALLSNDFDIEYVKGEDNVVADTFSRLLCIHMDNTGTGEDSTIEHIATEPEQVTLPVRKIPEDKYTIIQSFHNQTAGHRGVRATIDKLLEHKHKWQGMREHVRQFVRQCSCCQKMSVIKLETPTHAYSLSSYKVGDMINIDTLTVGEEDADGFKHVLVIVDTFSRWVKLYPLRKLDAVTAASCILSYCGDYGSPLAIRTDNGRQLVNSLLKEIYEAGDIKMFVNTPHSHEENGIVERANKEVLRHLRAYCFDGEVRANWSKAIPIIQRILNTTRNRITKATPAEIMFGSNDMLERNMFYFEERTAEEGVISNAQEEVNKRIQLQHRVTKIGYNGCTMLNIARRSVRIHNFHRWTIPRHVVVDTYLIREVSIY